jgi:glutaredoxin
MHPWFREWLWSRLWRWVMRCAVVLAVATLLLAAGVGRAELYSYTDGAGVVHFVDDPARIPKKYRSQVKDAGELGNVSVMDAVPSPPAAPKAKREEPRPVAKRGDQQVEVYLTSWCGYCKKMVRFLTEKGIPFTAYDIEKDKEAARVYRELGGRGVPLVRIGDNLVRGYNPGAVMGYYNGRE